MIGRDFYELFQARWNETHDKEDKIPREKAEAYCRTMLDLLNERFDEMPVGDRVTFYGFGSFVKKERTAHVIGELRTGARVELPAREKIVFTRAKAENRK